MKDNNENHEDTLPDYQTSKLFGVKIKLAMNNELVAVF